VGVRGVTEGLFACRFAVQNRFRWVELTAVKLERAKASDYSRRFDAKYTRSKVPLPTLQREKKSPRVRDKTARDRDFWVLTPAVTLILFV
jgi:hypothetical protein